MRNVAQGVEIFIASLESVFDLKAIDSFCDVGEGESMLTKSLSQRYPRIIFKVIPRVEELLAIPKVRKDHSVAAVGSLPKIRTIDKYDIVHCSIPNVMWSSEAMPQLLKSLLLMSRDLVVISWNGHVSSKFVQCTPARLPGCFVQSVQRYGFELWPEVTNKFSQTRHNKMVSHNVEFDGQAFSILKRRQYRAIHHKRFMQGVATDGDSPGQDRTIFRRSLQSQVMALRDQIKINTELKQPLSILRFGDGDLYFVNAIPNGSARPGVRALRKDYREKRNLGDCRRGLFQVDYVAPEINSMMEGGLRLMLLVQGIFGNFFEFHRFKLWRNRFFLILANRALQMTSKAFTSLAVRVFAFPLLAYFRWHLKIRPGRYPIIKAFSFSFEAVYALISSRIIFRMFPSDILLVGQDEKLKAIKELSKHKQYRDYLGIDSFCGYVGVPKIGAADDERSILRSLRRECKRTQPKVILMGIGSAKLYVIPRVKLFSNAVVIDVGAGIDALAGVVSQDRPYFACWTNFKLDSFDYSTMDLMDSLNPNRDGNQYALVRLASIDVETCR